MKILSKIPGYAQVRVEALLEGDEKDLPDAVLVMMADGRTRENAIRAHQNNEHPGHFGWRELSRGGNQFSVTIHTN